MHRSFHLHILRRSYLGEAAIWCRRGKKTLQHDAAQSKSTKSKGCLTTRELHGSCNRRGFLSAELASFSTRCIGRSLQGAYAKCLSTRLKSTLLSSRYLGAVQYKQYSTSPLKRVDGTEDLTTHARQNHSDRNQDHHGKILLALFVLGGAVYFISKGRPAQTLCEAETEKREIENDTKQTTTLQRKISVEEAIAEAQKLCQQVKDESGSPGLVVAVSVDGHQVWAQGLGFADVENQLPCKADTVMRIASISKSITMAAVAKAMESGDLDLDKPVQAYVPKFPEKSVEGEKVTLTTRHLVSHLGGIRHYSKDYMKKDSENKDKTDNAPKSSNKTTTGTTAVSTAAERQGDSRQDLKLSGEFTLPEYFLKRHFGSTEDGLALFKDDPLVHKPGSKYLYTSHGWTLIAAVLEGATKRKFPDIAQQLFKDLGLENTYLDDHQPLIYNRSRFYVRNKKGLLVNAPYVDCSYKYAGGGMLSTVPDLVHFGNAMLYSYQFRGQVSSESAKTGKNARSSADASKTIEKSNKGDDDASQDASRNFTTKVTGTEKHTSPGSPSLPGYLKSSTMQEIWAPVMKTKSEWDKDGYYAMGWATVPEKQDFGCGRKQRFYISHTGGAVGASSVLLILPPPQTEELSNGSNSPTPPRGVVVAIIVNMISVGLKKTALKIAKLFENVVLE